MKNAKQISEGFGDGTQILDVQQASRFFKKSASFFYSNKSIPALRIGKSLRYVKQDLVSYFKKQNLILR